MSEAWWLAGSLCAPSDLQMTIPVILQKSGVPRSAIRETHIFGPVDPAPTGESIFQWNVDALASHRLLHFIFLSVQNHEPDLLLLLESYNGQAAIALIGSPGAAGRSNLLPLARLQAAQGHGHTDNIPPGNAAAAQGLVCQLVQTVNALHNHKADIGFVQTSYAHSHLIATRVERI